MDIERFLKRQAPVINRELERILPRRLSRSWVVKALGRPELAFDAETVTQAVSRPAWDLLDRGGKRWRPALLVLCCEAVGGSRKKALKFAAIPELVHNGTLIVDDVEDGSVKRRGKPAVHVKFGLDLALNAGNTLYYLPLYPLFHGSSGLNVKVKSSVYDVYCEQMLKLSFGQAMDIYWHNGKKKDVSEADYLQMCEYKTGALACMAAKLGAILGGGTAKQVKVLGRFAATAGVAFQIQDDVLNLRPSTGWGKDRGEDIVEGKRSLVFIHAVKHSPPVARRRLLTIIQAKRKSPASIREAIRLIAASGAFEYAAKRASALVKSSWAKVEKSLPASPAKETLRAFADYLIERKL
ncbi:MAG: polyprenyl synthetase family protein [Candidatus Diapherotrites archaeon]|uniref:Polyprenyl synthetase family protein n=1 Tax=Candidatus Iainarchaeum sp. TaxID=3101447 RepID=A0A8T4LIG6_9ARCH|nr:polyprenyl synthetase family protein [Candidatus Diapherotrites archaeon]